MLTEILEDLSPEAITKAIEENALTGFEAWSRWSEMELRQEPGLAWTMTDLPFPRFNNVIRAELTPYSVVRAINTIQAEGRAHRVPIAWWTAASFQPANLGDYLEAADFVHAFGALAMAVELHQLNEDRSAPADLVIEEVANETDLRAWNEVYTEAFGYPDFAREPWFQMLSSLNLGAGRSGAGDSDGEDYETEPAWRHFLARRGGQPVAASSLFLGAGVAGIADVATLPEARRQGIGTAITLAPLREARRLGYRVGTLFSSAMGRSVYRQIGFRPYFWGNCYIWTPE